MHFAQTIAFLLLPTAILASPNLDTCLTRATKRWAERNEPCEIMAQDRTKSNYNFNMEKAIQWCYMYPQVEYMYQTDMCRGVTNVSKQQCYIEEAQKVLHRCEDEFNRSKKTKADIDVYINCNQPFPRCLSQ